MEKIAYEIEALLEEKLSCYKRLAEVMAGEADAIAEMDLDVLWQSSREKEALAARVGSLRERILSTLDASSWSMDMDVKSFSLAYMISALPLSDRSKSGLRRLKLKINTAKDEVVELAELNQIQVRKYLSVVDDIMSVIGDNSNQAQYTGQGHVPGQKRHNCLFQAEV